MPLDKLGAEAVEVSTGHINEGLNSQTKGVYAS